MSGLLLLAIFLPLLGVALLGAVASFGRNAVRWVALATTLATLTAAASIVFDYCLNSSGGGYAVTDAAWLGGSGWDIRFHVGLDGLGVWMFALSALLTVTAVLVSWEAIADRPALFYGMLLLLECGCLGVFVARDIILFYIFFEFTLIPLFFLIGVWGSEQRRYAAIKFFLFTLAGSVLTFLGLLAIVLRQAYQSGGDLTFSIPELTASLSENPLPPQFQWWIFLALAAGFAIKVPLFPLHTWLPLAHVQAPTAGSVILAGILLKIGTYGFLRFNISMLPDATVVFMPWLLWLAVIGILYGAFAALAQSDIKRLIAYSSVSHLGYCMLGFFSLNQLGMEGGALQMINHGISTGALFAVVGMIYERYHTREISKLGGLAYRMPWLAFFMLVFTFSSIGLPGFNGFAGELLVLIGAFQRAWAEAPMLWAVQWKIVAVLAVSGVVLGAWYMLWMVQRVFFGPLKEPQESEHEPISDMKPREILALAPLAVLVLWIGLCPEFFLKQMDGELSRITISVQEPIRQHYAVENNAAENASDTWLSQISQENKAGVR